MEAIAFALFTPETVIYPNSPLLACTHLMIKDSVTVKLLWSLWLGGNFWVKSVGSSSLPQS